MTRTEESARSTVRWIEPLRGEGRYWTGTVEMIGETLRVSSWSEQARSVSERKPPPGLEEELEPRIAAAISELLPRKDEIAALFAELHERAWRERDADAIGPAAMGELLGDPALSFPDGAGASSVNLVFDGCRAFGEDLWPQVTFERTKLKYAILVSRTDAKGVDLVPFDEDKHEIAVRSRRAEKPKANAKAKAKAKAVRAVEPRWTQAATFDAERGGWRGAIDVKGRAVVVACEHAPPDEARLAELLGALERVMRQAARDLTRLFNDSWREKGKITAARLAAQVRLEQIDFDAQTGEWTLLLSDGGLFGGHTIEVFRAGDDVETNLIG